MDKDSSTAGVFWISISGVEESEFSVGTTSVLSDWLSTEVVVGVCVVVFSSMFGGSENESVCSKGESVVSIVVSFMEGSRVVSVCEEVGVEVSVKFSMGRVLGSVIVGKLSKVAVSADSALSVGSGVGMFSEVIKIADVSSGDCSEIGGSEAAVNSTSVDVIVESALTSRVSLKKVKDMSAGTINKYVFFIFISIPFASLKAQNEMKIVAPSAYIIVFFPCRVVVHYKSRRSE